MQRYSDTSIPIHAHGMQLYTSWNVMHLARTLAIAVHKASPQWMHSLEIWEWRVDGWPSLPAHSVPTTSL